MSACWENITSPLDHSLSWLFLSHVSLRRVLGIWKEFTPTHIFRKLTTYPSIVKGMCPTDSALGRSAKSLLSVLSLQHHITFRRMIYISWKECGESHRFSLLTYGRWEGTA